MMDQQASQSLLASIVGVSAIIGGYLHYVYTSAKDWLFPKACPTAQLQAQLQTVIGLLQTRQLTSSEAVSNFPWETLLVWNLVSVGAVVFVAKRFSQEIIVGQPLNLAEIGDDDHNGAGVGNGGVVWPTQPDGG